MDILVRSCQDLRTILAKILPWYSFCHGTHFAKVRSYQESHVPKKNFIVKARKNLKGSQQNSTSMQIYIVRHDNFLFARYKIRRVLMIFRESLIKLFCQLQNCRQQRRQRSLELNHIPNCDYDRF